MAARDLARLTLRLASDRVSVLPPMARPIITRGSPVHRAAWVAAVVGLGGVVVSVPFSVDDFQLGQYTSVLSYAVALAGLNLVIGWSGQISLAHGTFFGLGAYTVAVTVGQHHWPYLLSLPVAAGLGFVVGLAVGFVALRLQGFYLALFTLAIAVMFPRLAARFEGLTGGTQGMVVPAAPFDAPPGMALTAAQLQWFVALGVAVTMFALAHRLVHGPFGRALICLRDHPISAASVGMNAAAYKSVAFALSAAYAGVAGAVFTFSSRVAAPHEFGFTRSLDLLAAAVVGGMLSLWGAGAGGVVMVLLPALALNLQTAGIGWTGPTTGVLLIVLMISMPEGLAGLVRRVRDLVVRVVPAPIGLHAASPGEGSQRKQWFCSPAAEKVMSDGPANR